MTDVFSKQKRSEIMSRIYGKNTKLEIDFLKLLSGYLYPRGYRYRKHYKGLIGKPDVVFIKQKVAIFIDGDFWHGYRFEKNRRRLPKRYWLEKIKRNIERDKKINRELKRSGWRVLRFWEHQVKRSPKAVLEKIEGMLVRK